MVCFPVLYSIFGLIGAVIMFYFELQNVCMFWSRPPAEIPKVEGCRSTRTVAVETASVLLSLQASLPFTRIHR